MSAVAHEKLKVAAEVLEGSKAYLVIGGCLLYVVMRMVMPLIEMHNQATRAERAINRPSDRMSLISPALPPRGHQDSLSAREAAPPMAA